ncbi:MAG: hypothetical protein KA758_13565 [Acidimicrobiales bacterium]|nr:hypothetical protein [Acidimicrobiales bacterium]
MSLRHLRLFPPIVPPDEPGPDIGQPGSRRRIVLVAAAITTVTEVFVLAGFSPHIEMGGVSLSLSIIPGLALAVACGDRLFGRSSLRRVAAWFWILATGVLVSLLAVYLYQDEFALFCALALAAMGEELVYRLAAPAVISVVLMYGGVGKTRARLAGLGLAGAWFVLLPGHQAQMDTGAGPLPFIAFAVLAAALVHRSGSVLPMAMGHAIVNLVTFLVWDDALPADARAVTLGAVLTLLALAYGIPRRITLDAERGLVDIATGLPVDDDEVAVAEDQRPLGRRTRR